MHSTTLARSELDGFISVVMHFALPTFVTMTIFAFDYMANNMTTMDKFTRLKRLITLQEAEMLCYAGGRNLNSYVIFKGKGDTGSAFASSYYFYNMKQSEHPRFSQLTSGALYRDPPIFIDVREGHSSQQLPEEAAATLKAYDQLIAMNL